MTTSIRTQAGALDPRKRARHPSERRTFRGEWLAACDSALAEYTGIRFPDRYWWDNPLDFWELILGVKPWSRQRDLILAFRDYDRVACKAGRRVSKSNSVSGIGLNYYCGWVDARVILMSTTARQVDAILWTELVKMRARAGRCTKCKLEDPLGRKGRPCPHSALIEGEAGRLARTGLKMAPIVPTDFREIWGFTATEAEAVQGVAGENVLWLADEASGIKKPIFDAINGNRAGGARLGLFGNPTKTEGEMFDAFHDKQKDPNDPSSIGYYTVTISSRESPNVIEGRIVVPGLATESWIKECEHEWGVDSALFKVHVLGEFAVNEDGKIFSIDTIRQAEDRWEDASEAGRLFLGVDPAGEDGMGDETAVAARRGFKAYPIVTRRGLSNESHWALILEIIDERRVGREIPVVIIDRDGSVGAKLFGYMRGKLEALEEAHEPVPFELYGLRGSSKPSREADRYDRQRDATTANLATWIRDGGGIPEDTKLTKEMHVFEWRQLVNGKMKVTSKEDVKAIIGRSPDRYDALSLSVWEPTSLRGEEPSAEEGAALVAVKPKAAVDDDFDPYDSGRAFDPYGGNLR